MEQTHQSTQLRAKMIAKAAVRFVRHVSEYHMNATLKVVAIFALFLLFFVSVAWLFGKRASDKPSKGNTLLDVTVDSNHELALVRNRYESLTFSEAFSSQAILDGLRKAPVTVSESQHGDDIRYVETMLDHVAEFLNARFESSTEEYSRWRDQKKYVRKSREELEASVSLSGVWKGYFGESTVPDLPFEELFAKAAEGQTQHMSGASVPIAISSDSKSFEVAIGRASRDGSRSPRFAGFLGSTYKYGSNGTFPSWWKPPHTLKELLAKQPFVRVAYIGFAAEFMNMERRAVSIRLIYDDAANRWYIDSVSQAAPYSGTPRFPRWEY